MSNDAWARVPIHLRANVRSYINSEQDKDREHAMRLCKRYKLNYTEMRAVVLAEMIEQSRALGKAWTPAAGSRPLSPADRDEARREGSDGA